MKCCTATLILSDAVLMWARTVGSSFNWIGIEWIKEYYMCICVCVWGFDNQELCAYDKSIAPSPSDVYIENCIMWTLLSFSLPSQATDINTRNVYNVDVSCLKLPPLGGMTSHWRLLILTLEIILSALIHLYAWCQLPEAPTLRWRDESLMASVNVCILSALII